MIQQIGKHRVSDGPANTQTLIELLEGKPVDAIYTDPPWGQGKITYFENLKEKDTGISAKGITLSEFLDHSFRLYYQFTKNLLFVDYGVKWRQQVISRGKETGFRHMGTFDAWYQGGKGLLPMDVHVFAKRAVKLPTGYAASISNRDHYGPGRVKAALCPLMQPGNSVLDPMCGYGQVGRVALACGLVFRGNELNEKRLAKTISMLKKNLKG